MLGTIGPGKRADVIVIDETSEDPYDQLIRARETGITLVVINGVPRFGQNTFMSALGATGESLTIGGQKRTLFLKQDTQDPLVGAMKLSQATATLKDALSKLPALAKELEQPKPIAMIGRRRAPTTWQLALDEIEDTGFDLRPRLRSRRSQQLTGPTRRAAVTAKPISQILQPLKLDPLTVVDDPDFLPALATERNLPQFIKDGLPPIYN